MTNTLADLLASHEPVNLDTVEASLARFDDKDADLEAALTGLMWRRRTRGALGLIETLVREDCVARRDRIPKDLDRIGARRAAASFRKLRSVCVQNDIALGSGVIDWTDTNHDFAQTAHRLEETLDDIAPKIWSFLRERREVCADVPVVPVRRGFLRRLFA